MSALIWVDTEKDYAIDLGNPFRLLTVFAEMDKLLPESEYNGNEYINYGELFGVPGATMDNDDVDPEWLADVKRQASQFLKKYGRRIDKNKQYGPDVRFVLETLSNIPIPYIE